MNTDVLPPAPILLRNAGTAVLLDVAGSGLPRVLHWGADPGELDDAALRRLAADLELGVAPSALDEPLVLSLLPGEADGWSGRPGLAGHHDGTARFPRLRLVSQPSVRVESDGAQTFSVNAVDSVDSVNALDGSAGLAVASELRLEPSGLLRVRHTVTNTGGEHYTLAGISAVMPLPREANELLDLTGRWCRDRSPQRRAFDHATFARESRRGRTGHDATLLMVAGTSGFGFRSGEVWAVHVAWSGDHVHYCERLPEGAGAGGTSVLGGGELLGSGEVRLAPGESYTAPWVCFAHSTQGLDGLSAGVHRWLRARPQHPRGPRPLVLNSWEAVYFNHDLAKLRELAERAAQVGVERLVLDDGWFRHRRGEAAGLGDWYVDEAVWPQGLRPFADHVRSLGMDFGLWVEPEMVNPDSDLARAHPDWVLGPPGGPRLWRGQVVLDVANPDAYAYLLERLTSLVDEIGVAFLKWDHNRDLHESGAHAQTLAVYRLLDELRARHPGLEIESCASGGARIDLEILERTDRVWGSDTNDPLERQAIHRWTGLLLPPELIGAHVASPQSHTTGRTADLALGCITSLFAHAGIEWDITGCTTDELDQLRRWAGLYRELRHLLHTGDVVRAETADPGAWLHGVVAADRREALFCYVRLASSPQAAPGRLRLPGLAPDVEYDVVRRDEAGGARWIAARGVPWWGRGRAVARGAVLEQVGLPAPMLAPSQAVLLHVRGR